MTRLFLTKIPFFREVIVSSFHCDHCGNHNAELQPAGRIQEKGVKYSVRIVKQEVSLYKYISLVSNLSMFFMFFAFY